MNVRIFESQLEEGTQDILQFPEIAEETSPRFWIHTINGLLIHMLAAPNAEAKRIMNDALQQALKKASEEGVEVILHEKTQRYRLAKQHMKHRQHEEDQLVALQEMKRFALLKETRYRSSILQSLQAMKTSIDEVINTVLDNSEEETLLISSASMQPLLMKFAAFQRHVGAYRTTADWITYLHTFDS